MADSRRKILEQLREKISQLPARPGVYLFKNASGVVLYVGKAKSLRHRVSSYFLPGAKLSEARGPEISRMINDLVVDVDVLPCESEVDALLHENRLIKDIQPRFNHDLKDDKSFPYLQIVTGEDFPRVSITRQPRISGVKLYGPFISGSDLRAALPLMQRVFKFRTCKLDIATDDESLRHFRPCILYNIKQCTGPCAGRVSTADYAVQIKHLRRFLDSKGTQLRRELAAAMADAAEKLDFELAAVIRDELRALESLRKRGLVHDHAQPEVFYVDPTEGLSRLAEILDLCEPPRTIEAVDVAHLQGSQLCGAMVCFVDGRPFKSAYRRYKIKTVSGSDDCASIGEVIRRRYKNAGENSELLPDIILIDGGKGQLSAARGAFDELGIEPPALVALAKKQEELFIGVGGRSKPIRLPRRDPGLRLLQAARDEAHRFVQHYHHILRKKTIVPNHGKKPKCKP